MIVGSLAAGARGFDANSRISASAAAAFKAIGYDFAIRYVRRTTDSGHDLNAGELATLLEAGLGVMAVQHVALPGWHPTAALGQQYGATAARESQAVGLPQGVSLWCDLEGVAADAAAGDVIDFCNSWCDEAAADGFRPGLYVGDACGLTAKQLHDDLHFECYWSAYNLNHDQYPAVRGVMMRQLVAKAADLVPGFTSQNLDVDVIQTDAKGDTPSLLLP